MTIYIDTLFFVNFFMDTVILFVTSCLTKSTLNIWKVFVGAIISAIYGSLMFFPNLSFLYGGFFKVMVSAFFVMVVFGYKNKKAFLRSYLTFWVVTLLAGGIVFGISIWTDFGMVLQTVVSNGIVYMNINPFLLICASGVLYFLMELYRRMCIRNFCKSKLYLDFSVTYMEKEYIFRGLIDTGCELFEPISGAPVIVVAKELGEKFQTNHKIFANTAAGQTEFDLLIPEKIESKTKEYSICENAVIAVSGNLIGDGVYNALINPMAIEDNKNYKKGEVSKCYR